MEWAQPAWVDNWAQGVTLAHPVFLNTVQSLPVREEGQRPSVLERRWPLAREAVLLDLERSKVLSRADCVA